MKIAGSCGRQTVVFCAVKKLVEHLHKELGGRLPPGACAAYHGESRQENKKSVLRDLQSGVSSGVQVVFATNALALGVDFPDVGVVVHYGEVYSFKTLAEEFGRCGRDGRQALCVYYHNDWETRGTLDYLLNQCSSVSDREVVTEEYRRTYRCTSNHNSCRWWALAATPEVVEGCGVSDSGLGLTEGEPCGAGGNCDVCLGLAGIFDVEGARQILRPPVSAESLETPAEGYGDTETWLSDDDLRELPRRSGPSVSQVVDLTAGSTVDLSYSDSTEDSDGSEAEASGGGSGASSRGSGRRLSSPVVVRSPPTSTGDGAHSQRRGRSVATAALANRFEVEGGQGPSSASVEEAPVLVDLTKPGTETAALDNSSPNDLSKSLGAEFFSVVTGLPEAHGSLAVSGRDRIYGPGEHVRVPDQVMQELIQVCRDGDGAVTSFCLKTRWAEALAPFHHPESRKACVSFNAKEYYPPMQRREDPQTASDLYRKVTEEGFDLNFPLCSLRDFRLSR